MKKITYLLLAVVLIACDRKGSSKYDNEEDTNTAKTQTNTKKTPAKAAKPIGGERINKSATIRQQPNGTALASLLDYVPVRCASIRKGWYPVSVDFDITADEYRKPSFRKGRKLVVNGVPAGSLLRDVKLPVSTNGDRMWATIDGYTEQSSIRQGTIIEVAAVNFLKQHKDYSVAGLQPFIHNFQLDEDSAIKPYALYYNYESGIDDPSPGYRLAFICQGKQLIGILHSRPLTLQGTTPKRLQRGFAVNFLPGIDDYLKEDFCKKFNTYIVSVD
ncbi:hypothetical protein SAMN05444266_101178 [Chitinophaga jiangningensis]|uniref:Lipoprotein n=1 Tax=Chitinophaga jiangningensis TaxID=1419482 RepID=A0A1M6VF37_9BACT|nr:hypothetical protein [Chitinophaga jiangningensis]SHK79955.1 hypothetical protein SAMN05444266_101178 [Chitinophaga jiangningensis]